MIFLKIMLQKLFRASTTFLPFTNDNTILIDDSLEKSVYNENSKAIFLESLSWNELDNNYLLDTLAPWLSRMNMHCMPNLLRKYVDQNWIGCPLLAVDDPLLLHMMRGMALSARNVRVYYNVIGVPDLNYSY